jgi:AraC-like DNA-binding protein
LKLLHRLQQIAVSRGTPMNQSAIHYPELLHVDYFREKLEGIEFRRANERQPRRGSRFTVVDGKFRGMLEVLELHRDVMLLLNHCHEVPAHDNNQFIGDGQWMHVQFRFNGTGSETLGTGPQSIAAAEGTCLITSYSGATSISRHTAPSKVQKAACLYLRAEMMKQFFRVPSDAVPGPLRWIVEGAQEQARFHATALPEASYATVNDILTCSLSDYARTAYLQAKAMELVALMLHALTTEDAAFQNSPKLSLRDVSRILQAQEVLQERWSEPMTLEALATRVGLNRSKLAAGFKEVFGVPVNAYWRDLRLVAARDLLRAQGLTVTDVASRVGYSEISSFTRAFTAKFGISPKMMRPALPQAELALHRGLNRRSHAD